MNNDAAIVMEKGKAVMDTVREDAPVVKEALSELRTEPKNAFAKLVAVFKDIWAKILEVGLIAAIVNAVKGLFGSAASSVTSRAADLAARIPDVSTSNAPEPSATAATAAPADPTISSGEGTPLLATDSPANV